MKTLINITKYNSTWKIEGRGNVFHNLAFACGGYRERESFTCTEEHFKKSLKNFLVFRQEMEIALRNSKKAKGKRLAIVNAYRKDLPLNQWPSSGMAFHFQPVTKGNPIESYHILGEYQDEPENIVEDLATRS